MDVLFLLINYVGMQNFCSTSYDIFGFNLLYRFYYLLWYTIINCIFCLIEWSLVSLEQVFYISFFFPLILLKPWAAADCLKDHSYCGGNVGCYCYVSSISQFWIFFSAGRLQRLRILLKCKRIDRSCVDNQHSFIGQRQVIRCLKIHMLVLSIVIT